MRFNSVLGVRFLVDIELSSQKVGLIASGHRGSDWQNAGLGRFGQDDLVLVFALFLRLELGAADLDFDLRVTHRTVVTEAVKVKRDLLSAENAHKLIGLGHCGKTWERLANGRGSGVTMVMAFAGPGGRGDGR